MGLPATLRFNLARLVRFRGRQSPAIFWPYAIAIFLLAMALSMLAVAPFIFEAMTRMQRFAVAHPDQATITQGPGSYSISISGNHPELFPDMTPMIVAMALSVVVIVLLLAAAVARRLHDSGRTGAWGLAPLPFLAYSLSLAPRLFGAPDLDMMLFTRLFLSNLLYLAALGLLIFLLARRGTVGANRFGIRDEGQ